MMVCGEALAGHINTPQEIPGSHWHEPLVSKFESKSPQRILKVMTSFGLPHVVAVLNTDEYWLQHFAWSLCARPPTPPPDSFTLYFHLCESLHVFVCASSSSSADWFWGWGRAGLTHHAVLALARPGPRHQLWTALLGGQQSFRQGKYHLKHIYLPMRSFDGMDFILKMSTKYFFIVCMFLYLVNLKVLLFLLYNMFYSWYACFCYNIFC